jgi:hypothetical protein
MGKLPTYAQVRRMAKDAKNIFKDLEDWTRSKIIILAK